MKNYYEILQLNKNASANDIKKSYRKLALLYHPDINPTQDANNLFLEIAEAYNVLSDEQNKSKYDLLLLYGINAEIKTNLNQEEKVNNYYQQDGGRKYGTSYKYKNYANNYREQKKKQEEKEAQEFKSVLIEKVLFISLMVIGCIAIVFALIDLFTIKIEGFQNFNGLIFGVLFTGLLFFCYYFVFNSKEQNK